MWIKIGSIVYLISKMGGMGGKKKNNFKRGGNVKFIVPASLTLEKNMYIHTDIQKQWESGILIHTSVLPGQI